MARDLGASSDVCAICRAVFCHDLPKLTSFLGAGVTEMTWRCTPEAPCHLHGIHQLARGNAKAAAIYPDELIVPWVQCVSESLSRRRKSPLPSGVGPLVASGRWWCEYRHLGSIGRIHP